MMLLAVLVNGWQGLGQIVPYCSQLLPITASSTVVFLPYCSNLPLDATNRQIERIIVAIHGVDGNGLSYLNNTLAAAARVPGAAERTLMIAPQFWTEAQFGGAVPAGVLFWNYPFWGEDSASTAANPRPVRVSSFAALDALLDSVCTRDRFPNLRLVVLAGHSGGGQMVQRYAVSSLFEQQVAASRGMSFRYLVMNPSSYTYFDGERVVTGTTNQFAVPGAAILAACAWYDNYAYGLRYLYPYHAGSSAELLRALYPSRDVAYLLGGADTDPNASGLSTTCASMLQGSHRLERGLIYWNYLNHHFGPGIRATQAVEVVPGIGHSGYGMMTSDIGVRYLFFDPKAPPRIVTGDDGFGIRSNRFGFHVSGYPGQVAVVEVSADLTRWHPLATSTVGTAPLYFSDPRPLSAGSQYYRLRVP